jgi:hypothetical protein
MRHQYWKQWGASGPREFYEKAFRRDSLAVWDAKWQSLSVRARKCFLDEVKLTDRNPNSASGPAFAPKDEFPPEALEQLAAAGFVDIRPRRFSTDTERVFAGNGTDDFAWRARILRRYHLLDAGWESEFSRYVDEVYSGRELAIEISRVLQKIGFAGYYRLEDALRRFVQQPRWQDWVMHLLREPLAKLILQVVTESAGVLPLSELTSRISGRTPEAVRSIVDKLVAYLVLVEDLQPETWELLVGFLPAIREKISRAGEPRERPPLLVCEHPKEVAPHGSLLVSDLRAVLLEIADGPPRIRSDFGLHQRQVERFLTVLEPLPPWLRDALDWPEEWRLEQALAWATVLQFVKHVPEGRQIQLHLNAQGHRWLSSGLEEQHEGIFHFLAGALGGSELSLAQQHFYDSDWYLRPQLLDAGARFFSERFSIRKVERGGTVPRPGEFKQEHQQSLRQHVDQALGGLKPGVFYRLDSVESHLAFGEQNPLNTGLPPDHVAVFRADQRIPPLEEELEEAGKQLLHRFVHRRLIPLGCVRAAIDEENKLCIAREPRLDAYFGRAVALAELAPGLEIAGRVVVQPDFSVIVIGLNVASVAELMPFCQRTTKGSGQGATVLKITRESVVKAVSFGLKPAELVARLTRLASNEVPANVLREVKEWSNWVRHVTLSNVTVFRCGDRDAADRVMTVFRRRAERVSDTMIAIDRQKLTAAERAKLLGQGILVQKVSEACETEPAGDNE